MLRIAICDDEEQSVADTKRMLECWASGASAPLKIDCFDNGDSLIRENDSSRYDIIFLGGSLMIHTSNRGASSKAAAVLLWNHPSKHLYRFPRAFFSMRDT